MHCTLRWAYRLLFYDPAVLDDDDTDTRLSGSKPCLPGGTFHGNFGIDKVRIALLLFFGDNYFFFALMGSLLLGLLVLFLIGLFQ